MGLVFAEIELISVDDMALFSRGYIAEDEIKRVRVSALVDSGSYSLVIPNHIKEQLGLRVLGERRAILANELEVKRTVDWSGRDPFREPAHDSRRCGIGGSR